MRYILIFLLLLFVLPVFAVDTDVPPVDVLHFPTFAALHDSAPPTADYFDLARRFFGVLDIPAPTTISPQYQLGAKDMFTITTTASGRVETLEAELRAIGEHIYVWIEASVDFVPDEQALGFAQRFDSEIYEQTRQLWGSEPNPGIDGDSRLHVLFTTRLDTQVAGFFMAHNNLPREIIRDSNEREMFIFSLYAYDGVLNNNAFVSAAAHEFQHMINNHIDPDEDDWMNEGYSMLTEHLLALDDNSWAYNRFFQLPSTQLNSWGTAPAKSQEYGAGMLFMLYFYERYGLAGTQRLSADTANGLQGVDNTLQAIDGSNVENFFADWVLANALRRPETGYGYQTLPANAQAIAVNAIILPYQTTNRSPQYATQYFRIDNPPQSLTIDYSMSDTTPILPVVTDSNDRFWYGVRSNRSNPTLTRAFDLSGVTSAALNYRVWYDLEAGWDYGYVTVSNDDGLTWQPQSTPLMMADNPNGKAYGVGYSGVSNGWLEDTVNLDVFAGQEIVVRFETITDDATLYTGMAVDDIRLDALGYSTDANSDNGDWQANGWIRTDNRLPQRAWIQVVQFVGDEVEISRFLVEAAQNLTIAMQPETTSVLVAVSPFAPLTLQPTLYTLSLSAG
jgi:immune inhibitor A